MSSTRKALLVAATGGHLEQLTRLEQSFEPGFGAAEYATFDDAQSRSLLAGRRVHYVNHIAPRDLRGASHALRPAFNIIRRGGFTDVISTGSGIAVPFLFASMVLRVRGHYIESAARSDGPSLSGRLVSGMPGVRLYSQYPNWASGSWQYVGSVFDGFHPTEPVRPPRAPHRVVVTLGTMRRYPFRRAVDAVHRVLSQVCGPNADILWQVGDTPVDDLGIAAKNLIPATEMQAAIKAADLVVAHSGIGSCLQILDAGHTPILLSRRKAHNEHVDDHQLMIARELNRRDLAVSRSPENLAPADVVRAMSRKVHKLPTPSPFVLQT